ncbi:hypothetical protein SNE40_000470 [Patella caerulea]|uniref:C-type lectin domain-containing protein n=1 Tax=Patella caerulea TaxID=87958 RepID=A0AAN8K575_PATCE
MLVKVCCAAFAFHENRKTCYFYDFKLQADYVNVTDPGLVTYVDVREEYPLHTGQNCMKVYNVEQTWFDANNTCSQDGGQLVTMTPDDVDLKYAVLHEHLSAEEWFWIGANDIDTEGEWKWNDGSTVQPLKWMPDNPDNSEGNEDCLETTNIHWNDQPCNDLRKFICEKLKF